ncbi:MAG TPA: hypothetical protein PKA41_00275 [Verrucomicrobiota bacterium]|nr:hypothetical protein [Verrucomicrobiota bacterium]
MKTPWQLFTLAFLLAAAPAGAQDMTLERPLPDVRDVLKGIVERAQQEDDERAFKQHYTYHRTKVKETRNGDGDLKKREEKRKVHIPKSTVEVADDDDDSPVADGQSTTNFLYEGKGKAFEKSDFALTDDLLSRFEFRMVARETIRGRPMLVIDFKPANKKLPEHTLKDKFINKAAGRFWVDEEDYTLSKAEVHLTDRVNVIGGLAGAIWKFNYRFDRERTEEGFWFVRSTGWHAEGRQVFLRRTIDYHEEKTDVKKYPFSIHAREDGITTQ